MATRNLTNDTNTEGYGYYSKSDNIMLRFYNWMMVIINVLTFVILLAIIASILFEIYHMGREGADYFKDNTQFPGGKKIFPETSESILKIIELLFLCSIPLLITTSFYKYYKKVIRSIFIKSLNEKSRMIETLKSSVDLSMTKYTFFSILVSTGFIILLRRFNKFEADLENNEIYLYSLMLIGIIALLYFTLRLKHGITEGVIKVIKEEKKMNEYMESQKFNELIINLGIEVERLRSEKKQLETEINRLNLYDQKKDISSSNDEIQGTA